MHTNRRKGGVSRLDLRETFWKVWLFKMDGNPFFRNGCQHLLLGSVLGPFHAVPHLLQPTCCHAYDQWGNWGLEVWFTQSHIANKWRSWHSWDKNACVCHNILAWPNSRCLINGDLNEWSGRCTGWMCPVRRGRNGGWISSWSPERHGHLLLVLGVVDLPGPVFFIKNVTHGIIAVHPKKPRTDISVIPREKEEDAYFPHLSSRWSGVPRG